jgi:hypothetical protein
MIDPRWVTAHGKQILVETLETPNMQARKVKKTRQQEDFALVPLDWAAETAKCTETASALVWIMLLYMAWKTKSITFTLTNATLGRYGVRQVAKRAFS